MRSGIGIVYGDLSMVDSKEIKNPGDQVTLSGKALRNLCNDPSNVLSLRIPFKPPTESTGESKVASRSVAMEVLRNTDSSELLRVSDQLFYLSKSVQSDQ
ncbi:MAG: hypothetical protein OXF06_04670 [Bacteroidetes bacterium]|nr:hypothetical protein [Bacteroidota bacterium]